MQCYTMTMNRFGGKVAQKPASVVRSLAVPYSKAFEYIVCEKCIIPISVFSCKKILLKSCEAGTYLEGR